MDPLRLSQIDEASLSSLDSDPLSTAQHVQSYRPPDQPKSRQNSTASVPEPWAADNSKSPDPHPRRNSGFRRRRSTLTSWLKRAVSEEALQEPSSRRLTRQFTQQTAPGTSPFYVDGLIPSSANDANEEVISAVLNSDASDSESDQDDASQTASLAREPTITKLTSIRRQVTNEVKDKLTKIGFFDPKFNKIKTVLHFVKGYAFITGVIMAIYSLYWGAMYHRNSRLRSFHFWVVVDEDDLLSQYVVEATKMMPLIGTWLAKPYQTISNDTIRSRVPASAVAATVCVFPAVPQQNCVAAQRQLFFGVPADLVAGNLPGARARVHAGAGFLPDRHIHGVPTQGGVPHLLARVVPGPVVARRCQREHKHLSAGRQTEPDSYVDVFLDGVEHRPHILPTQLESEILSLWIHDAYKERLRPVQNAAVQHVQARQHAAQRVRPDRLGRGHQLPAAVHNEVLYQGQRAGEQEEVATAQEDQTAA
ncbi:hypothetical protein KL942_004461 [Ogataea angusta]|uniref:DUF3533 domain-containing protein n=1 Tax=Pichia angusta TaxID=870730 RepID=A0ABQ7RUG1_PICAN|nr:hypothetical protein KL942_004461 [Ogataea angusta]KAG7847682.1 hypothetical protein KL940_003594 [Ogataea angusta]